MATATATRPAPAPAAPATNGSAQAGTAGQEAKDAVLGLVYAKLAEVGEGGLIARSDFMTLAMAEFRGTPIQPVAMGMLASTERWQEWAAEGLISLHDGGTKVGMPGA